MTSRDASLTKAFVVFLCVVAVGVGISVYSQKQTPIEVQAENGQEDQISPAVTPRAPRVQEQKVNSSKADKRLILRTTTIPEGGAQYSFMITDSTGNGAWTLFSKKLPAGASMALPFNTWDPTDTYVFLEEITGGVSNYYVLRTNGKPFPDGELFIDVGAVWGAKKPGYTIRKATGWASGTLLIIYTSKDDGSRGPAFWFEIPSTAILQLAS